ncbi:MAGa7180 family putative nuclease [Mycoplasma phocoeninasale]|uniref:YqaJ viral recombinase domain-containing protein n=1 Tax=Mycoplasma phocoeninasale TaxID=2726117 RepID=A0A858U4G7_9MOLU|nr:YqaJ viral recombinase family protein [Mycoplasma phocoeninasale]MBN0970841.1 hypothetical protein [Mycoplasma phocoeninasale]QJG66133.1 hypothetical protein HGG64_00080 [Mycoplasma phocoeninasale]
MKEKNSIIIPKRNYYNGKEYRLDFENQVFIVNPEFLKKLQSHKPGTFGGFRKMTGSALGDIMQLTNFNSQFVAYARLCGFNMPVLDDKYIHAGVVLEPKILKKIEQSIGDKIHRYPAQEYNYDYFKENYLFGGLPDGFWEKKKMIFEIKTANEKKLEQWNEYGVNLGYIKQAQLYAYLMGVKSFSIVACFLKDEDYANPDNVDISKRIVKNWNMIVNEAQVRDDMEACEKWFNEYTRSGVSPKWNPNIDHDLVDFLKCENYDEWEALYLKWVKEGKAVAKYEQ